MLDLVVERNTSTDVIFRSTLDTIHTIPSRLSPRAVLKRLLAARRGNAPGVFSDN